MELDLFNFVAFQLILDNFDSLMVSLRIFNSQCLSLKKFIAEPSVVATFDFSTRANALCFKDDLNWIGWVAMVEIICQKILNQQLLPFFQECSPY